MYPFLHRVLVILYAILPLAGLAWAIHRSRRGQAAEPVVSFVITCFSGILLGTAIVIIHIVLLRGRTSAGQVVQSWYFLIGLLCVMGVLRAAVREGSLWLFRVRRNEAGGVAHPGGWRASLASLLQTIFLAGIGLPLVAGTLMVHRVSVHSRFNPYNLAQCDYEWVSFPATDQTRLAGWWVPANVNGKNSSPSPRTVLLCCDLANDLDRQAGILKVLASAGYNVLAFDLRGNGDSGGQWVSFGDVERHDVLGALRWLKANHPREAEHTFGVGGGTGAAALIAAATDPAGESIEALAVFDTYADFHSLADSIARDRLLSPLRPWAMDVMLPIISAHAGSDLAHFAPADLVAKLWPRPILILHGKADAIIPLSEGQALLRAATYPKQALWLPGDQAGVYQSRLGASVLLQFLNTARAIPAI